MMTTTTTTTTTTRRRRRKWDKKMYGKMITSCDTKRTSPRALHLHADALHMHNTKLTILGITLTIAGARSSTIQYYNIL